MTLAKTKRTTVTRMPKRAVYDTKQLYAIIDEAIIGHLAFCADADIHSIPLLFWRADRYLYSHCSVNSRLVNLVNNKDDVCISFAIMDGLVLAKSAFHHSVNYRSVVVYGKFSLVNTDVEKLQAMQKLMDKFDEKRWQQIRQPNQKELNATAILKMSLQEAMVKMRQGPPQDNPSGIPSF